MTSKYAFSTESYQVCVRLYDNFDTNIFDMKKTNNEIPSIAKVEIHNACAIKLF